jgi:hypothetical protein
VENGGEKERKGWDDGERRVLVIIVLFSDLLRKKTLKLFLDALISTCAGREDGIQLSVCRQQIIWV